MFHSIIYMVSEKKKTDRKWREKLQRGRGEREREWEEEEEEIETLIFRVY